MSAQAGVFYRDGRLADREYLAALGRKLEGSGPDGGAERCSGPIGMAFRSFHVTPEDALEHQPVALSDGTLLTWDGRLDNREDLCLQLRDVLAEELTDAGIVGAAWQRWGEGAFARLLGDWALAIWSFKCRTLFLARDCFGVRPLYYWLTANAVHWSTEFGPVCEYASRVLGRGLSIDERWIAGFMGYGPDVERTPFHEVRCVSPGSYMKFTATSVIEQRYWFLDPELQIHYQHDFEYEERFRELFRQAVKCRLRAEGPVWAHLSGGLDSSAIVCMGDEILRNGGGRTSRIETVSAVYDTSPESDERKFISVVERQRGKIGHHFSDRDYPPLTAPDGDDLLPPARIEWWLNCQRAICNGMMEDGARVQISGEGGDELLGNAADAIPAFLDHIYHRKLRSIWKDLKPWCLALKQSRAHLLLETLSAMLPASLQTRFLLDKAFRPLVDLFNPMFFARAGVLDYLSVPRDIHGYRLPSAGMRSSAVSGLVRRVAQNNIRHTGCVFITYPYLDRRLVSFLVAIPIEQLTRPGERRSLMRRSLRHLLPQEILRRRSKKSPDSAMYRALQTEWNRIAPLLNRPEIVARGYIDERKLAAAVEKVRSGVFPVTVFLSTLLIERWLRRWSQAADGELKPIYEPDSRLVSDVAV